MVDIQISWEISFPINYARVKLIKTDKIKSQQKAYYKKCLTIVK